MKTKTEVLLKNLLQRIREKTPQGMNMATMLSDILCIGKEAVYRRLRGEVPFTFYEISAISGRLSISLDNIIGLSTPDHILLHLDAMRFENPREVDFKLYRQSLETIRRVAQHPASETGCSANDLPMIFLMKYRSLAEFKVFKWMYQYESIDKLKPMHEINYPADSADFCDEFVRSHRRIAHSYYILDNNVFANLVNQVNYFASVQLIRPEDLDRIRQDMRRLIDEIEEIAIKGEFESGTKVEIYISNLNLEATYCYYQTPDTCFGLLKFFSMNSISTQDEFIFEKMKNWIRSLKRLSVLISESGEMQRVQFFRTQREIISRL